MQVVERAAENRFLFRRVVCLSMICFLRFIVQCGSPSIHARLHNGDSRQASFPPDGRAQSGERVIARGHSLFPTNE
jgi:hypothetical protein